MSTEIEVLTAYPELRRLAELRDAGWLFMPTCDANGDVTKVTGLRPYPEGVADALHVGSQTDAGALRMDHTGGLLWQRDGTVADVVGALLALPAPSDPLAPRLVRGAAPRLWTPR
ncbi:hypothetical protein [Amycolatopsis thailandensis]|uniref:hypothetical protein n=1 Tax=Amycolatopsis thailandensis TaxID=589330 RepID=UPI00362716C1